MARHGNVKQALTETVLISTCTKCMSKSHKCLCCTKCMCKSHNCMCSGRHCNQGHQIMKSILINKGRGLIPLESCICCLCSKIFHQGQECLACMKIGNEMASCRPA